uniref:Exocyst complex component n=1 Tax=Strigamia maritima TaxID=126957 RepID=T1IIQ2_STRMM
MAEPGPDPQLNAEHEHLLYELESSDTSSVGVVIRRIYDGDELEKFMERLDARIKTHDRDIERMCNFHYEGFIESIRELLQVKNQAQKLKNEISQTDIDLQDSASKLVGTGEELARLRRRQSNIAAAIDSISICLPVLQTYATLENQVREKRYYSALKTLEQLEHTHLPLVANYRFFQQMRSKIPLLYQNIKDNSLSDLSAFLENVRQKSSEIGAKAMGQKSGLKQVAEQNNMDLNGIPKITSTSDVSSNNNLHSKTEMSPQDIVEFSPGFRESFETNYQDKRRVQAELAHEPPQNMRDSIGKYWEYLCGIVGFFVVEEHILNTADGLVNRNYLNDVWEKTVLKINAAIRKEAAFCKEDEFIIVVIHIVMLFSLTMQGYGYSVQKLSYLVPELRDQYMDILMQTWHVKFQNIFEHDSYSAIVIENEDEMKSDEYLILETFLHEENLIKNSSFPICFSFSYMVPKVYDQIIKYINTCHRFCVDLHLSTVEMTDMLRKSTNLLLTTTLSTCLSNIIKESKVGLPQLIQLMTNITCLEKSCVHLEQVISRISGSNVSSSNVSNIQGQVVFKKARNEVEDQIINQLKVKINGFLSLADYIWMLPELPVENDKIQGKASDFIVDLISFLKNFLVSIPDPPIKIVETSCMTACMYISQQLMKFLTDDKSVKQISKGALQQLSLDVEHCEAFASEPINGVEQETLLMYFSDLRQIINLFIELDWSVYFRDYGKPKSKYLRVTADTAITLLEKYRDAETKNVMAVFVKKEREKKRFLDVVLKQLRTLTANGSFT